jgi:hypothetical protein
MRHHNQRAWDVTGRRPSGRERPWVSPGRHVPPDQSPNRGQDHLSPHRTRLGGKGATPMRAPQVLVGIDVSKGPLEVALRPTDERWPVSHDEPGIPLLLERVPTMQPALIVLEATGGLEVPVAGGLGRGWSARGRGASPPRPGCRQRHGLVVHDRPPGGPRPGPLRGGGTAQPSPAARGAGASVACPADATTPGGAEAHGRAAPPTQCSATDARGHPGAHHLA